MANMDAVQVPTAVTVNPGTVTGSLTFGSNITAGNTVVFVGVNRGGTVNTLTLNPTDGQTYTRIDGTASGTGRQIVAWYKEAHPGGALSATLSGTTSNQIILYAVEIPASVLHVSAESINVSTVSHHCAPSGEIDTPDNSFLMGVMLNEGSSVSTSAPGGWSSGSLASTNTYMAYLASDTALNDQRCTFTSTGGRNSRGLIVSFVETAGAGGGGGVSATGGDVIFFL